MHLHEEVLLLALKDETGKVDWKASNFQTVMAGAIIAELLLAARITIDEDKQKLVTPVDGAALGNDVLDEAIGLLEASQRHRNLQYWIGKLAMLKGLKEKTAASLCEQGVLQAETVKVLFVFNVTRYPELDPEPERQLIARLEQAVFDDSAEVDVRTALLISLANPAGLLAVPFASRDLRKRKKRIKEISEGELIGEATGEAIAAAQAAIAVAVAIPIMVAPSGGSGSSGC